MSSGDIGACAWLSAGFSPEFGITAGICSSARQRSAVGAGCCDRSGVAAAGSVRTSMVRGGFDHGGCAFESGGELAEAA